MEARSKNRFIYYAPAICWGLAIAYFSLLSGPKVPDLLKSVKDYLLHFNIYFLLALLAFFGRSQFSLKKISSRYLLGSTTIAILFGGAIEVIQELFIYKRTGDWVDFLSNASGVLAAFILWKLIVRK